MSNASDAFETKARELSILLGDAEDAAAIPSPSPQEAAVAARLPELRAEAALLFRSSLSVAQLTLFTSLAPNLLKEKRA